jgi:glycosyltransferase involved in cell wall biosynthesis
MEASKLSPKYPFASIVVIVYNMEKTIKECLDSLVGLNYPKDCYEIIVVDGGSTDGTQRIVREYRDKHNVRMFIEKRKIRGYARNLGTKHAKGEIIAYIDADCSAGRKWLITHVNDHISNAHVGAVGGAIKHSSYDASDTAIDFSRPLIAMEAGEYLPSAPKRYISQIPTCNASFKKQIFTEVGFFEDGLHVTEDTELCYRTLKNGYKILFDPEAKVIHHDDYRFKEYIKARNLPIGVGMRLFMDKYFSGGRIHYRLQRVHRSISYRLPMSSLLIFILFPGIVWMRIIRNFHKMRYITPKMRLINFVPYVLLASISWVSGYLVESVKRVNIIRG